MKPTVSNCVRKYRRQTGLTQEELARAAGVSRQTINSIETGRYIPSLPLVLKLARLFGRPVEEIFTLE
jgi:putative transcriptional regulator